MPFTTENLMLAIAEGDLSLATQCLTEGVDPNLPYTAPASIETNLEGTTLETVAIKRRQLLAARNAERKIAENNIGTGDTPLKIAIRNRNCDAVTLLLEHGANSDIVFENKVKNQAIVNGSVFEPENLYLDTPLTQAVRNNDVKMVELLLARGGKHELALPATSDMPYAFTPLSIAITSSVKSVPLVTWGKNTNIPDPYNEKVALQLVNALIQKGVNPTSLAYQTASGNPLYAAIVSHNQNKYKTVDMIKALLQVGFSVNASLVNDLDRKAGASEKVNLLWVAFQQRNAQILQLLIEEGSNLDIDFSGKTLLDLAAERDITTAATIMSVAATDMAAHAVRAREREADRKNDEKIFDLLYEKSGRPLAEKEKFRAEALARAREEADALKRVQAHKDTREALRQTFLSGSTGYILKALRDGGSLSSRFEEGKTALHLACLERMALQGITIDQFSKENLVTDINREKQQIAIIDTFLEPKYSIDINATDDFGRTALHYVRDEALFMFLLERGAKLDAVDNAGNAPFHYFKERFSNLEGAYDTPAQRDAALRNGAKKIQALVDLLKQNPAVDLQAVGLEEIRAYARPVTPTPVVEPVLSQRGSQNLMFHTTTASTASSRTPTGTSQQPTDGEMLDTSLAQVEATIEPRQSGFKSWLSGWNPFRQHSGSFVTKDSSVGKKKESDTNTKSARK